MKGIEPLAPCMQSRCSPAELHPTESPAMRSPAAEGPTHPAIRVYDRSIHYAATWDAAGRDPRDALRAVVAQHGPVPRRRASGLLGSPFIRWVLRGASGGWCPRSSWETCASRTLCLRCGEGAGRSYASAHLALPRCSRRRVRPSLRRPNRASATAKPETEAEKCDNLSARELGPAMLPFDE